MTLAAPTRVDTDAPQWLVEFLLSPPLWFRALLILAAGACLVLAARRVYDRDLYIPRDEQREMLLIVGTVEAIAVGVMVGIDVAQLGYVSAVLSGLVGGFLAVEILRRADGLLLTAVGDERTLIAVAWVVIALVAFALPAVVSNATGVDVAIGGLAVGMLLWTVLQEYGPGETVGDVARESGRA